MKKIISLLVATVLLMSMTVTAFAAENQTVISMEIDESMESYELVIPATVSIDPAVKTGSVEVKFEDVELVWTTSLKVYVNSSNPDTESGKGAFLVNKDNDNKIHYNIQSGMGEIYKGNEMLTLDYYWAGSEYIAQGNSIKLTVDGTYPGGGIYTDTLTFRITAE